MPTSPSGRYRANPGHGVYFRKRCDSVALGPAERCVLTALPRRSSCGDAMAIRGLEFGQDGECAVTAVPVCGRHRTNAGSKEHRPLPGDPIRTLGGSIGGLPLAGGILLDRGHCDGGCAAVRRSLRRPHGLPAMPKDRISRPRSSMSQDSLRRNPAKHHIPRY